MDIMSNKSLEQINKDTIDKRKKFLPKYNGTVINNILKINDENLHEFYEKLNQIHSQLIFSKSQDEFLDMKGNVFNCERIGNENDVNYRERIARSNVSNAKGNRESLEIIKLEIPEIIDLKLEEYTFGTGSFSISVMTDDVETSEEILEKTREKIQSNKSFGNKFEVISPFILRIDLSIKVYISKDKSDSEKGYIRNKIKENIRNYINNLKLKETFSKKEIENIIFEDESVKNYKVFNFMINGSENNFKNHTSMWNERFLENNNEDSITII